MTQDLRHGLRFPLFAGLTAGAALLVALPCFLYYPLVPAAAGSAGIAALVVLIVAVVVSEALTVLVPGSGQLSLGVPLFVAIAVYAGPSAAAVAGIASAALLALSKPRLSALKLIYNLGNVVLTTTIPALVYVNLAPVFAQGRAFRASDILALSLAATLGTFVNLGLASLALNALYGDSIRSIWRNTFSWVLPSQLALGFVGVAIAQILRTLQVPGFALFVVPLLVARQTYQQSVLLKQAYSDMITSMVAALEAKDIYTKGHSLRVAEYAVMIAGSLEVAPAAVQRIEYAALLHDLGKVGVSSRVLGKQASLSKEEYDEIKRHPEIGAHIISDVPYLADLVPFIAAHHERLDGSGYGQGLSGDQIPFEACVLAVADAYDAMTSARPYRGAMSHEAAMNQLVDGCGTQFDENVVAAFQRALAERAEQSAVPEGEGAIA
jgi:putative nucleotidyltransferase with HDIG domain